MKLERRSRKTRGLAIIMALMILSLLLALMAAFLSVNRAGNRFTLNSVERRQANDVIEAAVAYAWFHLDKNRGWADTATPLSGNHEFPNVGPPILRLKESQSGEEGVVDGIYSPSGDFDNPMGTFRMRIVNNLEGRKGGMEVSSPEIGGVPPRSVRLKIESKVGSATRKAHTLLRPVPPSHSSASAGRNLNLDDLSGTLRLSSEDPLVNRVSAEGDLNLPFNENVKFTSPGEATSGGRLNLGGTNLAGASDDELATAGKISHGIFSPNNPTLEVKEFNVDDIALPATESNIPGGTWVFGDVSHYEYREHKVKFKEFDGIGSDFKPKFKNGDVRRKQRRQSLYNQLTSPTGQKWAAGTAIPGTFTQWEPPDPGELDSEDAAEEWGYDLSKTGGFGDAEVSLPKSDVHEIAPGLKANVVTAQFVVRSGYRMKAGGDFIVQGEGDRSPELYFGYNMTSGGVAQQESLRDGLEAAQEDPSKYMGAIITSGNFNVLGGILGYGSILAGGDLNIKASSGLRTAPGLGVVLKGQRILIEAATEPEPALPGEPVSTDYPVFRDAINAATGGDWSNYNNWLSHQQATREAAIDSVRGQSVGASASSIWASLNAEIGAGLPMPALSGWPSANITLDQYIRLKEFYQTVATGYNDGEGDIRWLDLSDRQEDAASRIAGVLDSIAYWAESYKKPFQNYLADLSNDLPDMFLEGLLYADSDIIVNAIDKSVRISGSVISREGDVTINGATDVHLVYDRELLDNLFAASGGEGSRLERVYFALEE